MGLPHRVPGRPELHYFVASGGYWLHHAIRGFLDVALTRQQLLTQVEQAAR